MDAFLNREKICYYLDKMFEVLNAVKRGQDSLRSTFDSKIEKLRKDVLSTIDDKIKAVKVDVDLQFAAIDRNSPKTIDR